jgi:membrane protein implicated in regulation of membrane protease activity
MRLSGFTDPERGPAALLRLAFYALVLAVACEVVGAIVSQLMGVDLLLAFFALALVSPLAYFIRESRQRRRQRHMSRRGAERTP